jgi:hypothetical protein
MNAPDPGYKRSAISGRLLLVPHQQELASSGCQNWLAIATL